MNITGHIFGLFDRSKVRKSLFLICNKIYIHFVSPKQNQDLKVKIIIEEKNKNNQPDTRHKSLGWHCAGFVGFVTLNNTFLAESP